MWRHQLKILSVECLLEPEASEPMLHCNGNKQAGPSFPKRSLPIVSSMIATNNRKPKKRLSLSNLRKKVSPAKLPTAIHWLALLASAGPFPGCALTLPV
jgi:hypothetical protein